jgi:excisionase family DNA binding protein
MEAACTIAELARMCAVTKNTVTRRIAAGVFPAFRNGRGCWRVRVSDLHRFLVEYEIPVPPEVLEAAKGSSDCGSSLQTASLVLQRDKSDGGGQRGHRG